MWVTIAGLIKVLFFFLDLWSEADKERAEKKAAVAKEVVDAFKETDPDKRASELNRTIGLIDRMRRK
jgi:hypothetical protein